MAYVIIEWDNLSTNLWNEPSWLCYITLQLLFLMHHYVITNVIRDFNFLPASNRLLNSHYSKKCSVQEIPLKRSVRITSNFGAFIVLNPCTTPLSKSSAKCQK